jgi:VanZ family protein
VTAGTRFARRALGLLVVGAVAFTVYGSLVPFDFHARELGETEGSFFWTMRNRWRPESRSDGIANVMLGIPLGFGLLGLLRIGTANRLADAAVGVLLLPMCMAFAAGVEFAQLYVPERTCAGSDVLCQGFGAAMGMIGWAVAGRWVLRQAEGLWTGAEGSGRLLIAYLALLAFVQLLPMDLSASPRDLYHKLRDDVVYVPFFEFRGAEGTKLLERVARLLQVFGLYIPIGLLARRVLLEPKRSSPRILILAFGIALGMEGLQLIVKSRVPSATDVVIGAAGSLAGWWIGWIGWHRSPDLCRNLTGQETSATKRTALLAGWFLGLAFISWQPFQLVSSPQSFDWIPGMPLESGNPLFALEEMLTKLVLFGLAGAMFKPLRAAALGLAASGLFEAGQTAFASHSPSITDVLLGGIGAAIGSVIVKPLGSR